jgi:3'(2'), 5'-bisphosphate nucleotidase
VSLPISSTAQSLAEIAHEAGHIILKHYAGVTKARAKADLSPVTAADEEAEALIVKRLKELQPGVPIIAEEAMASGKMPELGPRFFLVDPLDGTKEFLKRNGEFTVNIALIEDRRPVYGVVLAPASSRLFIGDGKNGAFEMEAPGGVKLHFGQLKAIRVRPAPKEGLVAIVSRTHRDTKTEEYLARYPVAQLLAAGSSLKFGLVASGEADLYPRHGPTMEWDTAAGQAVLEAAGGSVTGLDGSPLLYGKLDQGLRNPSFIARGLVSSATQRS